MCPVMCHYTSPDKEKHQWDTHQKHPCCSHRRADQKRKSMEACKGSINHSSQENQKEGTCFPDKLQIPSCSSPSCSSLEDTLNAKRSEPRELKLRQIREGKSSLRLYRVMRLVFPWLPRGASLIGMSAVWFTGTPANSQTRVGVGFPWLSQEHRIWDKTFTQREEDRISAETGEETGKLNKFS